MLTNLKLKLMERTFEGSRVDFEAGLTIPTVVNLGELVKGNPSGERWLRKLRAETPVNEYPGSETIELYPGALRDSMIYVLSPRDGIEDGTYGIPNGDINIKGLNGEVAILDLGPRNDGIGRMRFLRRGASLGGSDTFDSYGWVGGADLYSGYLVGELGEGNFRRLFHTPSQAFPIKNYLEVIYPCGSGRDLVVRFD